MKNVSNAYKKVIEQGGPFYLRAKVTLADSTVLELTPERDFQIDGNGIVQDGGSGFPLGVAVSKTLTIALDNSDDRYSNYDFVNARITPKTEAYTEDGMEWIQEEIFTVLDPVEIGDTIELTAYDDMHKADRAFTSKLDYPATVKQLLLEVCDACDIPVGSPTFKNETYQVQTKPEGKTARQIIGYIAQIACGNAVMQSGTLVIRSYDFGTFQAVTDGIKESELQDNAGYYIVSDYPSEPNISTDNITITGISTKIRQENEDVTLVQGSDEYCLEIENPLIEGNEETALALIGKALIGTTICKFSGSFFSDPTMEFMDLVCLVDMKDHVRRSFLSNVEFVYLNQSNLSCDLETPAQRQAQYNSNATTIYQNVKRDLQQNKTEWETAVDNLRTALENASGMYPTEVPQPDGSSIVYIHDKKTLEESKNVFKITSAAVGFSTDGGKTYPFGFMLTGEFIAKILYTIGINADYINTGTFTVKDKDGNITFQADTETGMVYINSNMFQVEGKSIKEYIDDSTDGIQKNLDNFEKTVNGSFKDGILTTAEIQNIQQVLQDIEKDKTLIDKKYDTIINSVSSGLATGDNLSVTFNADCKSEVSSSGINKYDYLNLYYVKDGKTYVALEKQSGADIAGKTIIVPSKEIYVSWYSDASGSNYYGFSVDSIKVTSSASTVTEEKIGAIPTYDIIDVATETVIATPHPYENNMRKLWHYKVRTVTRSVLASKRLTYINAYTYLKNAINGVIKNKTITDDERTAINQKITEYAAAIGDLNQTIEQANREITALASVGASDYGKAVLKITQDEIKLRVTSAEAESLIEQKADSIRLKANEIAWTSTYSSMSKDGILKCSSAELKGTMKCGADTGYWVQLASGGKLTGGYGSSQYGYIDYSASMKNIDTGVTHNGIQIQGGCLRISVNELATRSTSNVSTTAYIGGTGTMSVVSWIRDNGDGTISWEQRNVQYENGLMVTSL